MIKPAVQSILSTMGVCGIILIATPLCHAVPANPRAFHTTQPGGKIITPQLFVQGDEHFSFISDRKGFAVMKGENDWLVYARVEQRKTAEGSFTCLAPTRFRVGMIDQFNETLLSRKKDIYIAHNHEQIPKLLVQESNIPSHCATLQSTRQPNQTGDSLPPHHPNSTNTLFSAEADEHHKENVTKRSLENPLIRKRLAKGMLKQLVVLIRFADHVNRTLPEPHEYDIILNQRGGDSILAPTGSVQDVYLEISYNQLSVESVVYNGWITLSKTEEYYAALEMGTGAKFNEAISEAMGIIDMDETFSLSHFDKDEDGIIDVITFFHSGYGAENGGRDCETNAEISARVWSHFHGNRGISWCSRNVRNSKLCLDPYIVATGLWGTCSSIICRIGTVSHEIGHFLGLKDMYDGKGLGSGVGCYSIMASVWGFDISQRHPPPMDPWSKIKLGWISPVVLSKSGVYTIEASFFNGHVYKVQEGYPKGEYLLIENLQPLGLNINLPQGGLAVWHIDENASYDSEGYPGQKGWPRNGNHYIVALLQADGRYDLERGENNGDSGDLWQAGSKLKTLGPSKSLGKGPFPNTDSYQGRVLQQTGVTISDISIAGNNMTFTLIIPGSMLRTQGVSPAKQGELPPKTEKPVRTELQTAKNTSSETKSKYSSNAPVQSPAEKGELPPTTLKPVSVELQTVKNSSAETESEQSLNDQAERVYARIADFALSFTSKGNFDIEKLLTYTEEYLDRELTGYFRSQNILFKALDLQISDWSVSVLSSSSVGNSSKLSHEPTSGDSLAVEVIFNGEFELMHNISDVQRNSADSRILMSINEKQELNETSSLSSFLAASDDKDILGIQNVTAAPVVCNVYRGGGSQINDILQGSKSHHKNSNMAGITMMITILVFFSFVGGLYIYQKYITRKKSELVGSRSLKPLIINDASEIATEDTELSAQPTPPLIRCNTSDLGTCCTWQALFPHHLHRE